MEILPSSSQISTTEWWHLLDSNKTFGERARWELDKDDVCYLQKILEAVPYKTAVVQPLTFQIILISPKYLFWYNLKW